MNKPVTAVIVGAGHRAMFYAEYSLTHPDELQIVGVADPSESRREAAQKHFGFDRERMYESAAALASVPRFADAVINGTMDHQHIETAVPLLKLGYDMILEKPFACNEDEMRELCAVINEKHNKVMIGHVLRYTPFYHAIKERIVSGEIGDIINIHTTECVSYHHLSTSYVRGKWGRQSECHTTMLLAKCCHDVDIISWLMGENEPVSVSSYGSLMQFKPENAPKGAGERCLVDCPLVDTCIFSAKRIYLDQGDRWRFYVWSALEDIENPTMEDKIKLLSGDSPYGRCMYKCGNDVVDHQSLIINFKNGATASHDMIGGASRGYRKIHIVGTRGEIFGEFESEKFTVYRINPEPGRECDEELVDMSSEESKTGHGGGDMMLVRDFVEFVRTGKRSLACTSIDHSIAGHLTVFRADKSRESGGAPQSINIKEFLA